MPIVAVLNQKGGSGKTTLATNLAQASHKAGRRTLLVDTDRQASARQWAGAREEGHSSDGVPVVGLDVGPLERSVQALSRDYGWVFLDGAPNLEVLAAAAVKIANIVLIPVQPSPYDIWAAQEVVEMVKIRHELTGSPRAAFVIARAIVGTQLAADVTDALAGYGLPIFRSRTYQRVLYANAAASGLGVVEAEPHSAAADEIRAILAELEEFAA
jgi:chromosome partitioning protein